MLSEVTGEGTLPKVGAVVEPVVFVEMLGNVGHAQEDEEQPGGGPEQPSTLVVVAPLPSPTEQVLDESSGALTDVDGGR